MALEDALAPSLVLALGSPSLEAYSLVPAGESGSSLVSAWVVASFGVAGAAS